jgi:hypothetical protein
MSASPKVSAQPDTTHCAVPANATVLRSMAGMATLAMLTSGKLMNAATCVTASARQRLGTACSPGEAFARAVTGVDAGCPRGP